ncbi:tetratricopeptide repeat protein [Marinobacter zhejiangensis]|uniref:Tetratricopeptide repeat-containing protein n=1 Tax=Marinobacter zhejiangensis TaxID=488535 RepID=A0A1I4T3U8_9GAMM|nr:tetratricopeptide repeat protein [Marinobacter zhejiangensis]SFM71305.1 hypothetical protein SAMN04487963_3477 [Marinobacter zhejiangensis]
MDNQELNRLIAEGDNSMFSGNPGDALNAYQQAWSHSRELQPDRVKRVWLLLAIANAAIQHGDFDEAFDALAGLQQGFADTGVVAGNPLFHLFVGLTFNGLGENPQGETDNFARALICGGPEIFAGEDPIFLERMKEILRPPEELGTWDGYEGASRDLLNGATGYLSHKLTEKIGSPPPYRYED